MIKPEDAISVVRILAKDLEGVTKSAENFRGLPDSFWGYYARGHDANGKFGVIVTYSEDKTDVDDLMGMYESWLQRNKSEPERPKQPKG